MAVLSVIVVLVSLPIIAVVAFASSGVQQASDTLVVYLPEKRLVQLFDPLGKLYKEFIPVIRWPADGTVTVEFGVPHEPWEKYHTGIDIANREGKNGQAVYPMMVGRVAGVYDQQIGLGRHVVVDHGDNVTSVYGHLQEAFVKVEDEVKPDQQLGIMDSTGYSTGPHVHFMIKVFGIPINPRVFLDATKVSE
jgi:murein DD-endopeptidase MepM/ murein hydrolase activator NlpD